MDETTLNDLLECSVCLERLDTSSKVLPCQHTFCRKCLEVILSSRRELRCPECRILVEIKIDDLPPNVLLMRILEGMKNSAATAANQFPRAAENESKHTSNQKHTHIRKLQQCQTLQNHSSNALQEQKQQSFNCDLNSSSTLHRIVPYALAIYDFQSKEVNDLNFKKGDIILLRRKIDANWFIGHINGREGPFPSNYAKVIVPLPTPQCIALYDFKMGPNEEEGCLAFKKGTIISVLRRVDYNWAEGRIGSSIGIFPIAFVEMNKLANQLLNSPTTSVSGPAPSDSETFQQSVEQSQQQPQYKLIQPRNLPSTPLESNLDSAPSTPSTCTTTSRNSICSSNSTPNSVCSSPVQSNPTSPQNMPTPNALYRDCQEKRHSLNALLPAMIPKSAVISSVSLNSVKTNRHSAEILGVITPSKSPPTENHSSVEQNVRMNICVDATTNITASAPLNTAAPISLSRPKMLKSNSQQNILPILPWGYLALYPYSPTKADELELKKGCVYVVTERCLDGWFKGKNWQDISGVFPGNYVTPLRNRDQQQLMHQWKYVQNKNSLQQFSSQQQTGQQPQKLQQQHHLDTINARLSHMSTLNLPQQPPELPARHSTVLNMDGFTISAGSSSGSVWPKTLDQKIDIILNRNSQPELTSLMAGSNEQKKNHLKDSTLSSCFSITNNTDIHLSTAKDRKDVSNSSTGTSSSSGISLMKRLTSMKTRSKSPNTINNSAVFNSSKKQNKSYDERTVSITFDMENQPLEDTNSVGGSMLPLAVERNLHSNTSQPLHVRSGSCPSELLQYLREDVSGTKRSNTQQKCESQRISGNKERQHLYSLRQSFDGTLRCGGGALINVIENMNCENNPNPTSQLNAFFLKTSTQLEHQHQMNGAIPIHQKKSQSLDATSAMGDVKLSTLVGTSDNDASISLASVSTKTGVIGRDSRFRCIVSYPTNSEFELELNPGDIVYVHRKQKNGWYKGTHSRTNKSGLFPASFVEPDI